MGQRHAVPRDAFLVGCFVGVRCVGLLGLIEVVQEPQVLVALSPHYALTFCAHYKLAAFIAMGSVVLATNIIYILYTYT